METMTSMPRPKRDNNRSVGNVVYDGGDNPGSPDQNHGKYPEVVSYKAEHSLRNSENKNLCPVRQEGRWAAMFVRCSSIFPFSLSMSFSMASALLRMVPTLVKISEA